MKTAGDRDAERAIEERLAAGPADVVELADAVRRALPGPFAGAEGALHALLHRLGMEGRAVAVGRAASGSATYVKPGADAPVPPDPIDAPGPVPAAESRAALCVASGARDAEARGRIVADVIAHRAALAAAGRAREFGSVKAAAALVHRVDRRRTAICLPCDATERFQRFLFHEGPSIVVTLLVLGAVWWFAVEPRVIPSNSMRPGLVPGDRVVVWKVGSSSPPPRWSVLVFRRTDDLVLIKRAVGLPGERVKVWNGEAYADGRRLVKPDAVREALRERLFDERFEGLAAGATWEAVASRPGVWLFRPDLLADEPTYRDEDGLPEKHPPPREAVSDLYLDADFAAGLDAGLWIEWVDDRERPVPGIPCLGVRREGGRATVGVADHPGGDLQPLAGLAPLASPKGAGSLALSFVDGVVRASAGGDVVSAEVVRPEAPSRTHARVYAAGELRRLRIDRDVHYTFGGAYGLGETYEVELAPDALFLLGDHSGNSRDSRFAEVGPIPLSRVIGRAVFRVWPPARIGPVR